MTGRKKKEPSAAEETTTTTKKRRKTKTVEVDAVKEDVPNDSVIQPQTHVQVTEEQQQQETTLVQDVNAALSTLNLNREVILPDNVISDGTEKLNHQQFYLYYLLERQAAGSNVPDTAKTQKQLLENIRKLDTEGLNIIFVIMRMFSVKNNESKMFDLPYRAKILKEHTTGCYDLEFDLKDVPPRLQLIMHFFCLRHLETMEETRIRMW